MAPRVTSISDLRDNYFDNYFRAGVTFSCGSRDIYFDFGKPPVLTCFGVPFWGHFWSTGEAIPYESTRDLPTATGQPLILEGPTLWRGNTGRRKWAWEVASNLGSHQHTHAHLAEPHLHPHPRTHARTNKLALAPAPSAQAQMRRPLA